MSLYATNKSWRIMQRPKILMTRRPALNRVGVIGISVFSSKDLLNWQNEGACQTRALYHSQHSPCHAVAGKGNMDVLSIPHADSGMICMSLDLDTTESGRPSAGYWLAQVDWQITHMYACLGSLIAMS